MKKHIAASVLILTTLLTGCSVFEGLIKPVERKVEGNSLYSSKHPNAVITVDSSLQYVGMVPVSRWEEYATDPGGSVRNAKHFMFVSNSEDKTIDQLFMASFWRIMDGYWIPGYEKKNFIEVGKFIQGDLRFDTAIGRSTISREDKTSQFLEDNGFLLPSCIVFKNYRKLYSVGRDADRQLLLSYNESINCQDNTMFLPENINTERTQNFLKQFNQKADKAFSMTKS